MMSKESQNFSNHARFLPPWHFIAFPVLAINVIVCVVALFRQPISLGLVWQLCVAIALVLTVFTARFMSLTVQNRLIRLEERLRMKEILPEALQAAGAKLSTPQLVGLRFASDDELADLVQRIDDGELKGQKQIKQAIRNWRADNIRV